MDDWAQAIQRYDVTFALTPHFGSYVPRQSEKWGGSGASSSVKMGVSGTDFVGIKGGGSLELDIIIVKNVHALPMDGCVWLALWPDANPGALRLGWLQ